MTQLSSHPRQTNRSQEAIRKMAEQFVLRIVDKPNDEIVISCRSAKIALRVMRKVIELLDGKVESVNE